MKIISGRSHPNLAKRLSEITNIEIAETSIENFDDKELRIKIFDELADEDIIIVQSTSKPANDNLMELLLLADAAHGAGAKRIIAIIPYFGYGRQDRMTSNYEPISARVVANLLQAAGINEIITVDLHSKFIADYFKIPIQNLELVDLFIPFIKNMEQAIIISPDSGAIERARQVSSLLSSELVIINKKRLKINKCIMTKLTGNVKDRHCIIIDDIVDSATTLCQASELLISEGALSVNACITHGVLSPPAVDLIEKSSIKQIFLTDSIAIKSLPAKFKVISLENLIADSIMHLK